MMDSASLRKKYLEFFESKGHAVIPGASLIPEHDPTVLFTTAGMHPLVPYLLGEKHPAGKRLVNVQKCIRTGDIEDVGDEVHLTFFEMLGNWSLGDYWKKEAIEWSFEFLTDPKWLGIPKEKLAISCFAGDPEVPRDEASAHIWKDLGIPEERIFFFGRDDNWWGPAGQTGPCGPDTEMFYWTGKGESPPLDSKDKGWVEIWNDVFMEYNKTESGEYAPLAQKNVDTGMGVERTVAVLNGLSNVYETDVFKPIIKKIEEISGKKYEGENIKPFRIIADHIKAAVFMLAEGLEPSNVERGYVLRRLIRQAVEYGEELGINNVFTFKVAQSVLEIYQNGYPELRKMKDFVEEQLVREEEKSKEAQEMGTGKFEKVTGSAGSIESGPTGPVGPTEAGPTGPTEFTAAMAFDLRQTYGLSVKRAKKLAEERGLPLEENFDEKFQEKLKKHQELSRAGSEQKFKGGLADHSEQVVKYHTAAHLMLAALRQVLGQEVYQRGSNITAERLRFDFSHPEKMTPEELKEVEDIVNAKIKEDLPVKMEEMSLEDAKRAGAMGVFESKYGEVVKVYSIGDFSKEICGGPHVSHIGELGKFKIVKEESSSAGVRRIKAILE